MWRLFDRLFVCTLRAAKAARALDLPTVEVNQASAQAQVESRNNSHELRDFIVLPSSVWASHRNELQNYVRSRPHASKRPWPVHREMIPNQC